MPSIRVDYSDSQGKPKTSFSPYGQKLDPSGCVLDGTFSFSTLCTKTHFTKKKLTKRSVRIGDVSLVQNSTKHPQRASEVSEENSCKIFHSKFETKPPWRMCHFEAFVAQWEDGHVISSNSPTDRHALVVHGTAIYTEVWCTPHPSPGIGPLRAAAFILDQGSERACWRRLRARVRLDGRALDKPTWPTNQNTPLRHQICPPQFPPHPCLPVRLSCNADRIRPQNALDRSPCLANRAPHRITTPHNTSNCIHAVRSYGEVLTSGGGRRPRRMHLFEVCRLFFSRRDVLACLTSFEVGTFPRRV